MKRMTLIIVGIGLFMSMALSEVKPVRILTSMYPIYIMALNVTEGVPDVIIENLTKPMSGCLHDYSATPIDMKHIANSHIFLVNGLGMESFLDQAIKTNPKLKVVVTTKGIKPFEDNAHVWVSVALAQNQVKNLAEGLAFFDPNHAVLYRKNAKLYIDKLQKLEAKMQHELAPFKGSAIITFHEAFPYFAEEFGLKIAAVVEREPGSQPSAKELTDTIKSIFKHKVKAIFTEPQYPSSATRTIATETHIPVYVLDPAVTGPYSKDAYLNTMQANLDTLKKALR